MHTQISYETLCTHLFFAARKQAGLSEHVLSPT